MSNGRPSVWAMNIARVFSDRASSILSVRILYVCGSQSTKTGTSPFWNIGFTVVGNPLATVITSSPFFMARLPSFGEVSADIANKFALEPELTDRANFAPSFLANVSSKASLNLPAVSHISSDASIIADSSSAPIFFPDGGM